MRYQRVFCVLWARRVFCAICREFHYRFNGISLRDACMSLGMDRELSVGPSPTSFSTCSDQRAGRVSRERVERDLELNPNVGCGANVRTQTTTSTLGDLRRRSEHCFNTILSGINRHLIVFHLHPQGHLVLRQDAKRSTNSGSRPVR